MTDYELERLIQPITEIYTEIELELIKEVAQRLLTYETIDGTLEFYLKKLDELGALNATTAKIIAKYTNTSLETIKNLLLKAGFANVNMPLLNQAAGMGLIADPATLFSNPVISKMLDNSFKDLSGNLKMINTKAIEGARDAYMSVLNKAYIEVSSGIKDYNTAIKDGLMEMAARGITGATYQRKDGTIVHYTLEGTVRRDVLTAVFQTANRGVIESAEALGAEHVEVSSHLGARTGDGKNPISNHAAWQGQIYKIHGSDEYANLYEKTGYGQIEGLGGVNCRHRMFLFIKGVSKPMAIQYDSEENKRFYKATQKQRQYERRIRERKRELEVAKATGDKELIQQYRGKLDKTRKEYIEFINKNGLVREPEREKIQ